MSTAAELAGPLEYAEYGQRVKAALVDVLWPLWDGKHQTLHDKIVGSVVIRV